jgi:hypothetical protein
MDNCYNFSLNHKFDKVKELISQGKVEEARNLFSEHIKSRYKSTYEFTRVIKLLTYCSLMTEELFNKFKLEYKFIDLAKIKLQDSYVTIRYVPETDESIADTKIIGHNGLAYDFLIRLGHADPCSYMHELSHVINDPKNIDLIISHIESGLSMHLTQMGQVYEAQMDLNGAKLSQILSQKEFQFTELDVLKSLIKKYLKYDQDLRFLEPVRYKVLVKEIDKIRVKNGLKPIEKIFSSIWDEVYIDEDVLNKIELGMLPK